MKELYNNKKNYKKLEREESSKEILNLLGDNTLLGGGASRTILIGF